MFYRSTRNSGVNVTSAQAIAQGISEDGGLFVPSEIPSISMEDIKKLGDMTYAERAFFVFSSSIAANPKISDVLNKAVAGNEYWWAIGLSQIISNVPASIVLYPFTQNFAGLIYGADTAGLVSLIGSLASVINYRIYVREYPKNGFKFIKTFTLVSWAFFVIVVIPGFLLSRWKFF